MLTGRRLFAGETISDSLAAVLRQDVDWTALPGDTPASVRRLLARCLERDPSVACATSAKRASSSKIPRPLRSTMKRRIGWLRRLASVARRFQHGSASCLGRSPEPSPPSRSGCGRRGGPHPRPLPKHGWTSSRPAPRIPCLSPSRPTGVRSSSWLQVMARLACGCDRSRRPRRSRSPALRAHRSPFGRPTAVRSASSPRAR